MAFNPNETRFDGFVAPDPTETQTAPVSPAPTSDQAAPEPAPVGNLADDPGFRTLPRELQLQVEAGTLSLADALATGQTASPGDPGVSADNIDSGVPTPGTPDGGPPGQIQPVVDQTQHAGEFTGDLSAGTVLEGGRTGKDTFARPGTQGFQAFQGREFNPFLLRPEARKGAQLSAKDALEVGNVGRQVQGPSLEGSGDPFLEDLTNG